MLTVLSVMAIILTFAGIASAGSATATLQVTGTVVGICTVSTTAVNFGNVTGQSTAYSNGTIAVNCLNGIQWVVTLDKGQNYTSSRQIRASGTPYETGYFLYMMPNYTDQWGDNCTGDGGADTYPAGACLHGAGTGTPEMLTVYGAADAFTGIPVGTVMTDTVNVTVLY
jgi:spore coat protein U-like protein